MVYYYAHTGHKVGLERARRGAVVIKALEKEGVEACLLVNDFRAGVALKEHGIREYVTIETIQDIDAIAQMGECIIIDSTEDDHGRLVKYVSDFQQVGRFAHDEKDVSIHGEILFKPACQEADACIEAVIVDDVYFEQKEKEERVLFFLGDSDYDKTVLSHADFFKAFEMELLLGHYFFVKYEEALAKLFRTLHEPEEYITLIGQSSTVVTASSQTALEAKVAGAKVIYIDLEKEALYSSELLSTYGIDTIQGLDAKALQKALSQEVPSVQKKVEPFIINKIDKFYK